MPSYALAILASGWAAWLTPFFLAKRSQEPVKRRDHRARWGLVLQMIAYVIVWRGKFWERPVSIWQMIGAVLFFVLGATLAWSSTRALGKQWRIEAGLSADHQLITFGPYSLVRHPIYTSMLCMLLATGSLITPWQVFIPVFAIFLIGTQIRVSTEERLLASHFGEQFREYKRSVPAYIPFTK